MFFAVVTSIFSGFYTSIKYYIFKDTSRVYLFIFELGYYQFKYVQFQVTNIKSKLLG